MSVHKYCSPINPHKLLVLCVNLFVNLKYYNNYLDKFVLNVVKI